jgi:phosphoribosyl 1,2-cyclic phosphodiesterase
VVELILLGSGSKGNSALVRTGRRAVLIDAGLSALQLRRRLEAVGQDPARLDAIVLTHDHADHIYGLPVFNRRYPTPVMANSRTFGLIGPLVDRAPELVPFTTGVPFLVGELRFTGFPVPHDAADPVGFRIEAEGVRIGYATDLGHITPAVAEALTGCEIAALEANHDPRMLETGPYPRITKDRIASPVGHLSNESAAETLSILAGLGCVRVVLAHLSQINNLPGLARRTIRTALDREGFTGVPVTIASQFEPSPPIRL